MVSTIDQGRRHRKWQAVHQGLLDAADSLFRDHGVSHTTVEDIAEAADVARQTVFNHFPYKEVFALELGAVSVSRVAQQAHALLEAGEPALHVLQRAGEWLLEAATGQGEVAVVVARELLHPDPERAGRAAEHVPLSAVFEAILQRAHEENTVRNDLPLPMIASRVSAVLLGIVAQATTCEAAHLHHELTVGFDILLNGISARRI